MEIQRVVMYSKKQRREIQICVFMAVKKRSIRFKRPRSVSKHMVTDPLNTPMKLRAPSGPRVPVLHSSFQSLVSVSVLIIRVACCLFHRYYLLIKLFFN